MNKKSKAGDAEHPRFDRCTFEITFDPKSGREDRAYQVFPTQGRRLLEVLSKEAASRKRREITGARLREVLEASRDAFFPGTRQKEVFRIFQDYRARFVRAGFVRVIEAA